MHHQATHGALAGERVATAHASGGIRCKYCRSHRIYRVYRQGFFQERIYPIFGIYPWKCKACSAYMLLRKRERSRTKQEIYTGIGG